MLFFPKSLESPAFLKNVSPPPRTGLIMPVMTKAKPLPNDPIARLWQIARAWLLEAIHAFGAPEAVARTLSRFARHALARRLRALETFAMKLLLVEAARLPPPRTACARARTTPARVAKAPAPDPARPETWRVRFELRIPPAADNAPRAPKTPAAPRQRPAHATPDPTRERAKSEKLARRLEALRRV